ncbi:alcohol dehydrogenase catalytic domain-containing protein, partial [Actinacidiphila rubida]
MKAVRVTEFGPPEVLRVEEVADPVPSAGQVLVDVDVAGVGYGDVIVRSGRYPFPTPYVPGLEAGGTIRAVGPGADPA